MPEFLLPVDIGNRALQRIGADRFIDRTQGFLEDSKNRRQVSNCYGKLRRAELKSNVWTFATRRTMLRAVDDNTMILLPALWVSTTTYFVGSVVDDGTGTLWQSRIPNNLNFQPNSAAPGSAWEPYFGPMTVAPYSSTETYAVGELVYTTAGDGTYRVYRSLQNSNSDNPATATAYDATVTYRKNQVVTYLATAYMSLIDFNLNQTPSASPAAWNAGTTYASGAHATGSDGLIYTSATSGNVNHDPVSDEGIHWTTAGVLCPWTSVFTGGTGSVKWLQIGGAEFPMGVGLAEFSARALYPMGAGPSSQTTTANVYRLPAGFLRKAPQDPKAGVVSALGAPGNREPDDWLIEGDFIVTRSIDPIVFRFVADVQDVTQMHDLFCEMLSATIAGEICEAITNSTAKVAGARAAYKESRRAAIVDGIEQGAEEPPLDDFIACRA